MLNKIFLQGRLVADPELRHTPSGVPVASFRLAVDRDFKSKDSGERTADFVNIVAWRSTGEFVSKFFTKGRLALVEGRLQMRDYTDRDGNKRTAAEVVADNVYFCDSKRDGAAGGYLPGGYDAPPSNGYAPVPPAGGGYAPAPAAGGRMSAPSEFAELSDDDGELPF